MKYSRLIDENEICVSCVWFTNEAHSHLEGYVNKQNWKIWDTENLSVHLAEELYSAKITVLLDSK